MFVGSHEGEAIAGIVGGGGGCWGAWPVGQGIALDREVAGSNTSLIINNKHRSDDQKSTHVVAG